MDAPAQTPPSPSAWDSALPPVPQGTVSDDFLTQAPATMQQVPQPAGIPPAAVLQTIQQGTNQVLQQVEKPAKAKEMVGSGDTSQLDLAQLDSTPPDLLQSDSTSPDLTQPDSAPLDSASPDATLFDSAQFQEAASAIETPAHLDSSITAEVPGAQVVEQEPNPEISPELEAFMEKVDRQDITPPDQVVVADQTAQAPTGNYASQPVIVLPATQQAIEKGMKHPVKDSVRWLAEWCLKMMKKFHGIVVYREAR